MTIGQEITQRVNLHFAYACCSKPGHDSNKGNINMSACIRCLEEEIDTALDTLRQKNSKLEKKLERILAGGCMPIFKCTKCGCIENTATSNYWEMLDKPEKLCSECDPEIGKWHGNFQKQPATGFKIGSDGFLYHPDEITTSNFKFRMRTQGLTIIGDA